jgi:hypothetical protein
MANPTFTSREKMLGHQGGHARLLGLEFPLMAELPRQLGGRIRTGRGVGQHLAAQLEQRLKKRSW